MKDILEKARDLGRAIAKSERLGAVKTLRKEADGDEALQADLRALNELSEKIAKLEKDVKPVEPEDKHRLRELQQKVTGSALQRRRKKSTGPRHEPVYIPLSSKAGLPS